MVIDADGYCTVNDLPPSECAHCRGVVLPLRTRRIDIVRSSAHWDGDCRCGGEIEQGDTIALDPDTDEWVCDVCGIELEEQAA